MNLEEQKQEFDNIIKKYNLFREETASIIADLLTNKEKASISPSEFAKEFNMEEQEAKIFLDFINIGLRFKENHL